MLNINPNKLARIVKGSFALLTALGISLSPELQDHVSALIFAVYGIASLIQARYGE